MNKLKFLICGIILTALLAGCSTRYIYTVPEVKSIYNYKTAYFIPMKEDTLNLNSCIPLKLRELSNTKYQIKVLNPVLFQVDKPNFKDEDLIVTYTYSTGWFFGTFMRGVQINFEKAKTHKLLATSSYFLYGNWSCDATDRIDIVFDQLKQKIDD